MMLPCSQCSKICFLDDFYETDYSAEEFSAFCSKECKDNWDSRVPPEYDSDCTCEGCKRTLGQGKSPIEFWSYAEPNYFCGQMCRDKWLLGIADNLNHYSEKDYRNAEKKFLKHALEQRRVENEEEPFRK